MSTTAPASPSSSFSTLRQLFLHNVTRDIPPVVYFHEQSPDKLEAEVSEYIITGGWPENHPNHRRVPSGIHEQYVRLLSEIARQLEAPEGISLPAVWISGFYGSGKSSFAKLLGLALDGVALHSGISLAEALLRRDTSPRAAELREAWSRLRQKVEPIAVVFDVGAYARDGEHVHSAAVRKLQEKLGYCREPLVADFELRLERDGQWDRFREIAAATLGRPWDDVKHRALAEEDFSLVMSRMFSDKYTDPTSWFAARAGTVRRAEAPEDAVAAVRDMLHFRRKGATVFFVVDEVSQYVLGHKERTDRLRAFATALGSSLEGKAWLLALGQQKLDEKADDSFLVWAKDRFPQRLRIHLEATNIRDVVHTRLLKKKPEAEPVLRALFDKHRPDLKLFGYECEAITAEEFVEVYPLLPGHIDLLLRITSALRLRSSRAQGDDQAIRGLLQLLGELFRGQGLADEPLGTLITLDRIYDVQHTALESDVQASMARILEHVAGDSTGLLARVAKAVALLELIQENFATDARLVARCLFDRLDRGDQTDKVTEALEELRRRNLLGYSDKLGYKIQSSAAEEWERERRDIPTPREARTEVVIEALKNLVGEPQRPLLAGRPFPWAGRFSDGRKHEDTVLVDTREGDAAVVADFRYLPQDERTESTWVRRSAEPPLDTRLVWVCGDPEDLDRTAGELMQSRGMVTRLRSRRESLAPTRKLLLQQEEINLEDLEAAVRKKAAAAWMAGRIYFRGRSLSMPDLGTTFAGVLEGAGTHALPDLFPHFVATTVTPSELMQLVAPDLSGPSPKFLAGDLGILDVDGGRYVPACSGVVPRRVLDYIEREGGTGGTTLLAYFSAPPFGYTANVVKACVAGLLRASKVRIQPEAGALITAYRDAGVQDLFDKDRPFRRATLLPAGEDAVGPNGRARICRFFQDSLGVALDREDVKIADAVASYFPQQAQRLRMVLAQHQRLPGNREAPRDLVRLGEVLEQCIARCRNTGEVVLLVKKHLDALREGMLLLNSFEAELTTEAIEAVRTATTVRDHHGAQLRDGSLLAGDTAAALDRIIAHLGTERPWRDITALGPDVAIVRAAYQAERRRLLGAQEEHAEAARARVKKRDDFARLTGVQSHAVLRPIGLVVITTGDDAIAPPLKDLRDPFLMALQRAEEHANELLDEILAERSTRSIERIDLGLRNRELGTEADVDAMLAEIRTRLVDRIRAGARIRLL